MNCLETMWRFVQTGGPIMIPLVLISIWMWYLIVQKLLWIFRIRRYPLKISEALNVMAAPPKQLGGHDTPRSGALNYFLGQRRFNPEPDRIMWEVAVKRQLFPLNRHMAAILVLATVAPLLGLLGTVTGMVDTFRVIGVQGASNPQALASGIKEALITTQTGLLIAIPGLLAGQTLRKMIRNIQGDLMIFYRAVDQWLERNTPHV